MTDFKQISFKIFQHGFLFFCTLNLNKCTRNRCLYEVLVFQDGHGMSANVMIIPHFDFVSELSILISY